MVLIVYSCEPGETHIRCHITLYVSIHCIAILHVSWKKRRERRLQAIDAFECSTLPSRINWRSWLHTVVCIYTEHPIRGWAQIWQIETKACSMPSATQPRCSCTTTRQFSLYAPGLPVLFGVTQLRQWILMTLTIHLQLLTHITNASSKFVTTY